MPCIFHSSDPHHDLDVADQLHLDLVQSTALLFCRWGGTVTFCQQCILEQKQWFCSGFIYTLSEVFVGLIMWGVWELTPYSRSLSLMLILCLVAPKI